VATPTAPRHTRAVISLRRRATINDVELAWDEWGSGPGAPFLLVHGYTGSSHDFALQIDGLAERRRVVALDLRGHGRSAKLHRLDAYSMDQLRADVAELITTVIGEPVDLLGHSMGGYLTAWLTIERPELVRSLLLMDTSSGPFGLPDVRAVLAEVLQGFDPAGPPPPAGPPGPETALVEAATPPEWRDLKASAELSCDPFAIKALGLELVSDDLPPTTPRLGDIAVPVTVLAGSEDRPLVDQVEPMVAGLADAEAVIIDGAYHSPQLTHPAEWRAAVERHLDRVLRRPHSRNRE